MGLSTLTTDGSADGKPGGRVHHSALDSDWQTPHRYVSAGTGKAAAIGMDTEIG